MRNYEEERKLKMESGKRSKWEGQNIEFFHFYSNKYTYPHRHTKKTEGVILQWEELASKKEER